MKLRRFVLILALVAMFGALLQGCGGGNNGNTGTKEPAGNADNKGGTGDKQVTLKVWGDLGNQGTLEESFKKINAAFQDKHPNIKLEYDFAQNDQSLNVALQANELPDLFWVQGDKTSKMSEMVKNGFIKDLTSYNMDLSRFSDAEKAYCTIDGKLYCSLPSFFDTNVVYYNKDLFDKNGIQAPANWDEFVQGLDKLKAAGVTPIALAGKSEWDRAWPIFALAPALSNEALVKAQKGEGKLTDPAIAEMLQTFRDFTDKGYFGKDFLAQDYAAAQLAFTNGKAAAIIDGTWANATYVDSGLNLGRFPIPNKEGKKIVQSSYSNFMTYAISNDSKHPDEAVKYLEFLNSLEAQQILEDSVGLVPTIKDITPKDEGIKELAVFDEAGVNIYSVLTALSTPESNTADILMKDVIPKLMTSATTGEEAAAVLDKAANYPAK
ncbi:ABC transporter substrate-binding protein [Paenibacillus spongiae]|uniref:Sugar ABC transporter substrate-binding protein n=1 Tax=Paenibacillus spongiae TaxID=2909671 RepID=A0ABY5SIY2_9BACL|nr:sugar ABC transporter substrate-binding protein [Paenibacillus spongiae]UVI32667.1 sugar ABC transporter substrate-binding protein [Paenibacillus spongiae]